jgi:PE family protein
MCGFRTGRGVFSDRGCRPTRSTLDHLVVVPCFPHLSIRLLKPAPSFRVSVLAVIPARKGRKGWTEMSAVIAVPELMAEAATDLATIGSNLRAAHMTAAPPTVALQPAGADEVSASIAHLFSGYGQEYQKLAREAAASHEQFAQHLTASAGAYASAEAANVALLQDFPICANLLSASATELFTDPATSPLLNNLLFGFLILTLFATIIPLLVAISIPVIGVVLPLVIAVTLPLGIVAIAALFGPIILAVLLGQLGAVLSPAGLAAAELFPAFASFGI